MQTATISSALPFTIIMILMCWGLLSALRVEAKKRISFREARMTPTGPREARMTPTGPRGARMTPTGPRGARNWKNRLHAMMHQPKRREVVRYIHDVVKPTLSEVAEELRKQSLTVEVGEGDDDRVWVEVRHGDEIDFFYSVHSRSYEPLTFVMRDTRDKRLEKLKYYWAEVHLKEGGQDYDVMGWGKDDLIHDVLEQYERHMHFLAAVR